VLEATFKEADIRDDFLYDVGLHGKYYVGFAGCDAFVFRRDVDSLSPGKDGFAS
jgi:hypothetical protein